MSWIIETAIIALRAYIPLLHAVKTGHPRFSIRNGNCKVISFFIIYKICAKNYAKILKTKHYFSCVGSKLRIF